MSALRSSFSAIARVTRGAAISRRVAPTARPIASAFRFQQQFRGYAASSGLTKEAIETRVIDVLKSFEKVKPEKVSLMLLPASV